MTLYRLFIPIYKMGTDCNNDMFGSVRMNYTIKQNYEF